MSLHPGETGTCSKHGRYDEYCNKCADIREEEKEYQKFKKKYYTRLTQEFAKSGREQVFEGFEGDQLCYFCKHLKCYHEDSYCSCCIKRFASHKFVDQSKIECIACYEEEGSFGCIRPTHDAFIGRKFSS